MPTPLKNETQQPVNTPTTPSFCALLAITLLYGCGCPTEPTTVAQVPPENTALAASKEVKPAPKPAIEENPVVTYKQYWQALLTKKPYEQLTPYYTAEPRKTVKKNILEATEERGETQQALEQKFASSRHKWASCHALKLISYTVTGPEAEVHYGVKNTCGNERKSPDKNTTLQMIQRIGMQQENGWKISGIGMTYKSTTEYE